MIKEQIHKIKIQNQRNIAVGENPIQIHEKGWFIRKTVTNPSKEIASNQKGRLEKYLISRTKLEGLCFGSEKGKSL